MIEKPDRIQNANRETSTLVVKKALTGERETITVTRGVAGKKKRKSSLSSEVQVFQKAMKDGSVRNIESALSLIPVSERTVRTIGRPLLVARKHRRNYKKILKIFRGLETQDASLIVLLTELFFEQKEHKTVVQFFDRLEHYKNGIMMVK